LIDGAHASYGDHILSSIRKVGFDPADIQYILISHGHLDHFGGVARIQKLSGARVVSVEEDWQMVTAAADGPGRRGGPSPRVPARDMVVDEGDTLTLGDTTLILHHTPGHTPGVLSFELTVFDNGAPHRAFYSGGVGGRGGVEGFEAAVDSNERILQLENIEVVLTGHSWLGDGSYPNGAILERAAMLAERGPNDPHPFVDAPSWEQWINAGYQRNLRGLEAARREAAGVQ
jgi:metallo-beta-lactamase class B